MFFLFFFMYVWRRHWASLYDSSRLVITLTYTHSRCQAGFTHQWMHLLHLLSLMYQLLPSRHTFSSAFLLFFYPSSEGLPSHLFAPAVTSCGSLFTIPAFYSPHSLSVLLLCRTTSHSISEDFRSKQYQFNSIRKWSIRTWALLCDCVFVCKCTTSFADILSRTNSPAAAS